MGINKSLIRKDLLKFVSQMGLERGSVAQNRKRQRHLLQKGCALAPLGTADELFSGVSVDEVTCGRDLKAVDDVCLTAESAAAETGFNATGLQCPKHAAHNELMGSKDRAAVFRQMFQANRDGNRKIASMQNCTASGGTPHNRQARIKCPNRLFVLQAANRNGRLVPSINAGCRRAGTRCKLSKQGRICGHVMLRTAGRLF